jgi:YaiO family outer membrane protein
MRAALASGVLAVSGAAAANQLELGGMYYDLSAGYAPTSAVYGRGRVNSSALNEWLGEIVRMNRFDDSGTFVGIGNVHHFNDRWFSNVALGTSSGGFFFPEVRIDSSLSRKWLDGRNLVTTLGVGYYQAKDQHRDTSLLAEASYYFAAPWVLQAGTTLNNSDPGGTASASGRVALSYVRDKQRIVSAQVGGGNQAYQAITAQRAQIDFPYYSVRLNVKQWCGYDWGFSVSAESYQSRVYDQRGIEFGLFKEF